MLHSLFENLYLIQVNASSWVRRLFEGGLFVNHIFDRFLLTTKMTGVYSFYTAAFINILQRYSFCAFYGNIYWTCTTSTPYWPSS